jgi:hypothetical protein
MCVPGCMPAICCMCWAGLWFRSGVCSPVRLAATPAECQRASGDVTLGLASFVIAGSLPAALKNQYMLSWKWHCRSMVCLGIVLLSRWCLNQNHMLCFCMAASIMVCCAHTLHCHNHKGLTFSHNGATWRQVCRLCCALAVVCCARVYTLRVQV